MKLTKTQIHHYHKNGFLIIDGLFTEEEVQSIRDVVVPTQQLLNDPSIYLYQYKLNNKKAFGGGIWEWHQDYPFWHIDDGVKESNMLSVMVLLQDTDHAQGPLMFIPRSHTTGIADFQHKAHLTEGTIALENSLNGDLKFTIKNHGSNANISPYDRNTAIMTYNVTSNVPEDRKEKNRPDYICLRDFNPIDVDNRSIREVTQSIPVSV